jgi:succinate-acetate transporter protein
MADHGNGWANPGPAGLVALAMACFTFFALFTGKVDGTALPLLGIWLIGGFAIQVIVGIIELKEGSILGGNVFLFFSAFFMLVTGLECLFKFWMGTKGITLDARMDGWAWLALAIALIFWTPGYFKSPLAMILCVLSLDIAVPVIALKDLTIIPAAIGAPLAGIFLLLGGIFGLYMAAGTILNTTFGKQVLPLGSPWIKG